MDAASHNKATAIPLPPAPLMNSAPKPIPLLVATLNLLLGSATATAVGLGDFVVHSSLGEPLRAEVRLLPASNEILDATCFKLATPGTGSSDDLPWIRNARLTIKGSQLLITTREAINHPIAMLGLRAACDTELRRDYTVLLQPPMERVTPPNADLPVADNTARFNATTAEHPRRALRQPNRPQVSERPTLARQPSSAAAVPMPPRPSTRGARPHGDRLLIGTNRHPRPLRLDYQLALPPQSADTEPKPERTGKQTLAALDDSITAQLELNEKIKRLEEYQAVLRKRVAELDQQAANSTAQPTTAPAPAVTPRPPVPAEPPAAPEADSAPNWLAVLAGILAVIVGGGALLWMRRRRPEGVPAMDGAIAPEETHFHAETAAPPHPADAAPPRQQEPGMQPLPVPPQQRYEPAPLPDETEEWAEPTFAPAHPIPFDETVDEQDSALELAEIMMSFGRTQGAAETLADYIRGNPRQAVKPWLKLLDVYHVAGMRAEFEALTRQLNKTFNVKTITWADFKASRAAPDSVEQMEHVTHQLQELWGTQEAQVYIHQLLRDNRNGTRQGFPLSVVEELLLLLAILDDMLGTYRPNLELTLAEMDAPNSKVAA